MQTIIDLQQKRSGIRRKISYLFSRRALSRKQCYVEDVVSNYQRTLTAILESGEQLDQVFKADLQCGDWLLATTLNSTYNIRSRGDGSYLVSGGWYDRKDLSPFHTWIAGCTWGGSVIKIDIVAARGLHIEFGDHVVTSPVQEFRVFQLQQPWQQEVSNLVH